MVKKLPLPELLQNPDYYGFFDDFLWLRDELWTETEADAASTTAIDADGLGGRFILTTGTTDNDECLIETPEFINFADNQPFVCEVLLQYAEANTDDANVAVFIGDAPGADLLVDDGAGPKTSYDGACIFKVDGGTVWKCQGSDATTQTTVTSKTTAGGTAYQKLRIEWAPITSTRGYVTFSVDDVPLQDTNVSAGQPDISIELNPTNLAEQCAIAIYGKSGGANAETITVDYVGFAQLRA